MPGHVPQIVGGDGKGGKMRDTVFLVHSFDLKRELAAPTLEHVEIDLIPLCQGRPFRPWKSGKWTQIDAIDRQNSCIDDEEYTCYCKTHRDTPTGGQTFLEAVVDRHCANE
jgi:hypothetical protein